VRALQAARHGNVTWQAQTDPLQMLALQCLFVPMAMLRRLSQNARDPAYPAPLAPTPGWRSASPAAKTD